jgi:hypothetical protein
MNELEFLRSQLRLEQTHFDSILDLLSRTLRQATADRPLLAARQAALAHLEFALQRATEQSRVHSQLLPAHVARSAFSTTERRAVLDAVAALQSALVPDASSLRGLSAATAQQLAERISQAAAALEPWCARLYDLSDWRRAACIDAEAVFEERRLYDHAIEHARAAGLLE